MSSLLERNDGGMKKSLPFVPDQRVFCNDNDGGLYECIIRKASWTGQQWTFLVHYVGWHSRWDKWLGQDEILENTEENRVKHEKAKQQQQQREQQQKRKRCDEEPSSTRRKRPVDRGPSYEDYCELPFTLKTILVEDRERIMRLGFDSPHGFDCNVENWRPARDVHHLPAKVTVQTVLNHYVKCKKKDHAASDESKARDAETKARAFVEDIATLFDEALPVFLLYQPERAQHLAIQADPDLSLLRKSDLYGCEHLLRFFVRLPVLLEEARQENRKVLGTQLADLIVLLQKNRKACFNARYREPKAQELTDWETAIRDGAAPVCMDE